MADDYAAHDVRQLWQMVESARAQLPSSREQIAAWQRAHSMLDQHVTTLRACRTQLAELWPPQENAASAAYLAELDRLLDAAGKTAEAAQNNATHIGYVADAIEQAHAKLTPIYQEYLANAQKLADYQQQIDAAGDVGAGIGERLAGDLGKQAGHTLGEGAMELFTSPPVAEGRQEELNRQARAIMRELSGVARDGSERVQPPPEYVPPVDRTGRSPTEDEIRDDPTDRAVPPPVIDRPPYARLEHEWAEKPDKPDKPGQVDGHPPLRNDFVVVLEPDALGLEPAGTDDQGPLLSAVTPPQAPPTGPSGTPGAPPGAGSPSPSGAGPGPGLGVPPRPIVGVPAVGTGASLPHGTVGGPGRIPVGVNPIGTGPATTVPPGGVIGARPGGVPPGGAGGPVGGAPPRVNPVGGVIGPPGGATAARPTGGGRPAGGAGPAAGGGRPTGSGGPVVPGARRGRRDEEATDRRRWDPDNPWAVEEGVAPAIEPSRQVDRHDPGTGIIGKDR